MASRPPLTPRLIAIRQAVACGDYSCLGDGGEALVFAHAKRCGITAPELLHEWAGHDVKLGDVCGVAPQTPKPPRIEMELRDLDFWANDTEPPIDDDPPDMPDCSACGGSGKSPDGGACPICNGRGKIPGEDQPDDDEEEKETFKYEYEEG